MFSYLNKERISIHAPRTGSDNSYIYMPLRILYFNPRSPHGERQTSRFSEYKTGRISIHAPRTGSDG